MTRCTWPILLIALGLLPAGAVTIDQPLMSDTFDGRALGVLTATGGWTRVDPADLKAKRRIEVLADSGNLFGGGTANRILLFQNIAADPVAYDVTLDADNLSATNALLMIGFDFHEPSSVPGGIRISVGGNSAAANPVNVFELSDGVVQSSGSYSLDATHRIDVVFNETGSPVNYDDPAGGSSSLNTGLMDIWIDQTRVGSGVSNGRSGTPSTTLASIELASSDTQQEIYLDNFQVKAGGAVDPPEPPPQELVITNLLLAAGNVTLEWNQLPARFIVVAAGQVVDMMAKGETKVSSTTATNAATFAYDGAAGFFRVQSGIAAVDGILSSSLWEEVKVQSTANAPTNRIYDTELDGMVGMTLPGWTFSMAELTNFSRLGKLSLAGSGLTALGDLSSVTNLTWLNLAGNQLTDVSGLNVLGELEALNLESNLISNLSGLEDLSHLRWLDLESNLVSDLAPVVTNAANGGLGDGDELWIRGNPLSATATNQIQTLESIYNVKVHF